MALTNSMEKIRWQWRMRHNPECFRDLSRDVWRALLLVAVLLSLASVALGAWLLFSGIPDRGNAGPGSSASAEGFDRAKLRGLGEGYEQRALEFERLKKIPSTVADPSR